MIRAGSAGRFAARCTVSGGIGVYRLICKIEDDRLTVLVLATGHRRSVYG